MKTQSNVCTDKMKSCLNRNEVKHLRFEHFKSFSSDVMKKRKWNVVRNDAFLPRFITALFLRWHQFCSPFLQVYPLQTSLIFAHFHLLDPNPLHIFFSFSSPAALPRFFVITVFPLPYLFPPHILPPCLPTPTHGAKTQIMPRYVSCSRCVEL